MIEMLDGIRCGSGLVYSQQLAGLLKEFGVMVFALI